MGKGEGVKEGFPEEGDVIPENIYLILSSLAVSHRTVEHARCSKLSSLTCA